MLSAVDRLQIQGYRRITILLGAMDTDGLGKIIPSAKNYGLINSVGAELQALFYGQDYLQATVSFAQGFNASMDINNKLYGAFSNKTITTNALYQQSVLNAQRQGVAMITGEVGFQALNNPIANMMNTAISTNMSLSNLVSNLSQIMLGEGGKLGALAGHANRVVSDSFAFADRTYGQMLANDLDVKEYLYQGGTVASTRPFCSCRVDNKFTKEEIEDWGKSNYFGCGSTKAGGWKGRHYETTPQTIFVVLGGYNCRHALIPYK